MTWQAWAFLAAFVTLIAALIFGGLGCSTRAADLERMQRDVQNCILEGGTPRLGPDRSVVCL